MNEAILSGAESRRAHWDNVYATQAPTETSWYQEKPVSLSMIEATRIEKSARIVDVGGGASTLVDHLLAAGHTDVTVLDISEKGLDRAKVRLGPDARKVNWIVADATQWSPEGDYDLWHDHAVFHYLMAIEEQNSYMAALLAAVPLDGHAVISGFSQNGPRRCDGLAVVRRNPDRIGYALTTDFSLRYQMDVDHHTPCGSVHNFAYTWFQRTQRLQGLAHTD